MRSAIRSPTVNRFWWSINAVKLGLDFMVLAAAYCLAFLLRFEGNIPPLHFDVMLQSVLFILFVQYICLVVCQVPQRSWRYVSITDVRRIGIALTSANTILA